MLLLYLLFVFLPLSSLTHKQQYSCRTNAPCGCSIKRAILAKIVGGETARTQSWSWLVSLSHYSNHQHFCGGSILSSSWILTAAHCVSHKGALHLIVNAGSNKLDQSTQQRRVAKIISHPYFDPETFVNDIALIELSSPLNMKDAGVARICLPMQTADAKNPIDGDTYTNEYPPVGSTLIAVGWGQKAENVNSSTKELQQVTLKAVAYESSTCRPLVSSAAVQFCAGVENGGKDTCQGDSGGPLMEFASSERWVLAGITSAGEGCGRAEHSGVYTRVAYYLDWINATMNTEDVTTDSVLTAHDTLITDEAMNDISPEELVANMCSHNDSPLLPYIFILIGLSLYFI